MAVQTVLCPACMTGMLDGRDASCPRCQAPVTQTSRPLPLLERELAARIEAKTASGFRRRRRAAKVARRIAALPSTLFEPGLDAQIDTRVIVPEEAPAIVDLPAHAVFTVRSTSAPATGGVIDLGPVEPLAAGPPTVKQPRVKPVAAEPPAAAPKRRRRPRASGPSDRGPQTAGTSAPAPKPEPEPKPEPKLVAEPKQKPVAKSKPGSGSKPKPAANSNAAARSKPVAQAERKREPSSRPEPKPKPRPATSSRADFRVEADCGVEAEARAPGRGARGSVGVGDGHADRHPGDQSRMARSRVQLRTPDPANRHVAAPRPAAADHGAHPASERWGGAAG